MWKRDIFMHNHELLLFFKNSKYFCGQNSWACILNACGLLLYLLMALVIYVEMKLYIVYFFGVVVVVFSEEYTWCLFSSE